LYNDFFNKNFLISLNLINNKYIYINDSFSYLTFKPFFSFFKLNKIDIPNFFKNTNSLRRNYNSNIFLKIVAYLMRKGLKYKTLIFFLKAVNLYFINSFLKNKEIFFNWKIIYIYFNNKYFINEHFKSFNKQQLIKNTFKNNIKYFYKNILLK